MKNIINRNAVYTDIPQLVSLRKLFLSEKYGVEAVVSNNSLQLQIENYFSMHLNNDIDIIVAELNGDIIGAFCIIYLQLIPGMNPNNEGIAYLSFDYIKPEFRIEEIRKKLFENSIQNAKRKNANVFEVEIMETEFQQYEKMGYIKSPFPLVRAFLSETYKQMHMTIEDKNITFRKAEISDLSYLVDLRVQFLAEVSGEQEILIKEGLSERLEVYLKEHLNNELEVYVAEYDKEILSAIFVIYYERIPEIELHNGKVGVPINFYVKPSFRTKNLLEYLFEFTVECSIEREVRLFEMAIIKEKVQFYEKIGFEQMQLIPVQLQLD